MYNSLMVSDVASAYLQISERSAVDTRVETARKFWTALYNFDWVFSLCPSLRGGGLLSIASYRNRLFPLSLWLLMVWLYRSSNRGQHAFRCSSDCCGNAADPPCLRQNQHFLSFPAPLRRAKFSVQIRDLVDLVVTRLSDLNGQSAVRRRNGTGSDHDRSPGMGVPLDRASSHLGGGYGDPITKEVRQLACWQCPPFPASFVLDCSSIGPR